MSDRPPSDPGWGQAGVPDDWQPQPYGQQGGPSHGQPAPGHPHGQQPPHGGYQQQPPPYGYQQPPGQWGQQGYEPPPTNWGAQQAAPVRYGYAKQSQATTALVLSILGFFCCPFLAVPGAIMGRNEMKAVDAGLVDPGSRGTAQAAFIIGLIVLAINVAVIVFYVFAIAIAASSAGL